MRLRQKIIVLAVLPLVIAVLVIAALVAVQTRALARQEAALLEESMLAAKRTELRHYVELAQTAIAHIYDSGRDDLLAREEVKRILAAEVAGIATAIAVPTPVRTQFFELGEAAFIIVVCGALLTSPLRPVPDPPAPLR